jgi:hypothetical protein
MSYKTTCSSYQVQIIVMSPQLVKIVYGLELFVEMRHALMHLIMEVTNLILIVYLQ